MTIKEYKRKMQADGWKVREVLNHTVFEISADRVPTFYVTFREVDQVTDIGLLIAEKLRPAINPSLEDS